MLYIARQTGDCSDYRNNRIHRRRARIYSARLNKVLVAVVSGELDLNYLARKELSSRGLDKQGQWVGFDKANQIHNV